MRAAVAALLVVAGCAASGCGGVVDPSKNQLETVTGTLVGGHTTDGSGLSVSVTGPYNISKSGEYVVTFTNLTPPLALSFPVTIAFGLNTSAGCQPISQNTSAVVGRQVLGTSITPGAYCLAVVDPGLMSSGVTYTYTLSFSHP